MAVSTIALRDAQWERCTYAYTVPCPPPSVEVSICLMTAKTVTHTGCGVCFRPCASRAGWRSCRNVHPSMSVTSLYRPASPSSATSQRWPARSWCTSVDSEFNAMKPDVPDSARSMDRESPRTPPLSTRPIPPDHRYRLTAQIHAATESTDPAASPPPDPRRYQPYSPRPHLFDNLPPGKGPQASEILTDMDYRRLRSKAFTAGLIPAILTAGAVCK